ncbi:NRDE family protein [Leptospira bouyouniensis]|uniref:NRDE family protein n=1 Tax=Leptospira bouyouniensis TaxID=2484911 RepID=UPI001090B4F7|nr:NRDE family protein [Leptospira bouyouniensis]TGM80011.1 NRDE family protein [Leptospira bouyouniensis]
MCLAVIAFGMHPDFPLVVVSNRDEFFERPTEALHVWEKEPKILAGKDLKAGGTWLGVNALGKLAFLTNVRNLKQTPHPNPKSRGSLVLDFLKSEGSISALEYAKQVQSSKDEYEGFNLFLYDGIRAIAIGGDPFGNQTVESGFHAVSNASWNTSWPKTEKLKSQIISKFSDWTNGKITKQNLEIEMFLSLNDAELVNDINLLPDTGIGIERERYLSSVRIKTPKYGTRASTIVFYGKNSVEMIERSFSEPLSDGYTERRQMLEW